MQSSRELIVEPVGLDVETLARPIDFALLFGNDHPVELEIGSGKGTFLIGQAKSRPGINFLGIEYARGFWRYASDRLRRAGCSNAHTVRAEAGFFLREFIGTSSLSAVHIYFPDPWPKKRHNKRRLIQLPFVLELARVLKPAGRLQIVTDHEDYYQQIQAVMMQSPFTVVDYVPPDSVGEGEFAGTNFERKYKKENRPFYALAAVKA